MKLKELAEFLIKSIVLDTDSIVVEERESDNSVLVEL